MACNGNAVATADSWLIILEGQPPSEVYLVTHGGEYYFGRSLPIGAPLPE